MGKITIRSSSVEVAIKQGLNKLKTTQDNVDITIIDEGKKGFFGFGQRDAVVEMTLKKELVNNEIVEDIIVTKEPIINNDNIEEEVTHIVDTPINDVMTQSNDNRFKHVADYLTHVAKEYGAYDVHIRVKETSKKISFQIETEKAGLLIGKHGKIINALQVLAQTMVYRADEKAPMVVVNIGDYRQKREEKLKEIADRTAKRVLKTNQAVFLEELPAFERKIIHARLSKYDNIMTYSEGREPHRYLVVDVKK